MLLRYYGADASLSEVEDVVTLADDGLSALDLVNAAERFGLPLLGVGVSPNSVADIPVPAIVLLRRKHFVILERFNRKVATIIDPAWGRMRVPLAMFQYLFCGVALCHRASVVTRRPHALTRSSKTAQRSSGTVSRTRVTRK